MRRGECGIEFNRLVQAFSGARPRFRRKPQQVVPSSEVRLVGRERRGMLAAIRRESYFESPGNCLRYFIL